MVVTAALLAVSAPGAGAEETPAPTAPTTPTTPTTPTEAPQAPVTSPPAVAAIETPAVPVVASASPLPLRSGATGWRVRVVQDRLAWLGYPISDSNRRDQRMASSTVAAVKKFQSKFGFRPTGVVGPGTWDLLGQISGRVGVLPKPCRTETAICIDKKQRLVRLVERGRAVVTLDARFGFVGAETREGVFRVQRKSRDHWSSLYGTWMPFALFFSGGQAVHYSPYFARDGYNGGSHGCVNLRDFKAARWLYDEVPLGTPVVVYRS